MKANDVMAMTDGEFSMWVRGKHSDAPGAKTDLLATIHSLIESSVNVDPDGRMNTEARIKAADAECKRRGQRAEQIRDQLATFPGGLEELEAMVSMMTEAPDFTAIFKPRV